MPRAKIYDRDELTGAPWDPAAPIGPVSPFCPCERRQDSQRISSSSEVLSDFAVQGDISFKKLQTNTFKATTQRANKVLTILTEGTRKFTVLTGIKF